ncbi:hypothetical protein [Deinococcus sp.]|uniref:hypothetical protein n=1 Tax=Deinococcus sp. TaxID=47478 RepID=UPI003C7ABB57
MELEKAVAGLYRAFADVPRPRQVTGCTHCCISEEELARLVSVPREALTADELETYSSNLLTTVGSEADFRYFLPRILELVAHGELQRMGVGWELQSLRSLPWTTWPGEQVDAVQAYLLAWWRQALSEGKGDDGHLAILSEIGPAGEFQRSLDAWLTLNRLAIIHLAEFIHEHITRLALGKAWNEIATRETARCLYGWLRSGPPAHALEQAHDADPSAPDALLLLEAAALVTP